MYSRKIKALMPIFNGLIGTVAISFPLCAHSRTMLEEVVVTAQKRAEDIQNVPIAITAIGDAELQKLGVVNFTGIAQQSPSISFTPYTEDKNVLSLAMRGQGANPYPVVINSESSVGLYKDGFFLARPQVSNMDVGDVERVEVLRGPQGTLYGRNTVGGAINIITRKPSGTFGLQQILDYGDRDYFRSKTVVDLPAVGGFSTKVSVVKSSIDGYVKNANEGSNDFGDDKTFGGQFQVRWQPSDAFTVDYSFEQLKNESTPYFGGNPGKNGTNITANGVTRYYNDGGRLISRTTFPYDLPLSKTTVTGNDLTITWDLTNDLTLKSLSGYQEMDNDSYGLSAISAELGGKLARISKYNQHQISQEFQFIGSALDQRIKYVAGLYYFREKGSSDNIMQLAPTYYLGIKYDEAYSRSEAVYGQITWTPDILSNKLDLTLGGRYTKDERKAHVLDQTRLLPADTPLSFDLPVTFVAFDTIAKTSDSRFNPTFVANYSWTDDVSTYGKVATGYRSGGAFFGGNPPPNDFDPEDIVSYEVGLKSYWLDRSLRLNVAAFHNKFDDMQVPIQTSADGRVSMLNVGKATIQGLEIEVSYMPLPDLTLSLNYAYLDTEIDEFPVVPCTIYDGSTSNPACPGGKNPFSPYVAGQDIADLFIVPMAPEHAFNIGVDYDFLYVGNGRFSVHLDYRWQDKIYPLQGGEHVPGRDITARPSYGLLNGRLSYSTELERGDRVSVELWSKNMLDEDYILGFGGYGASETLSGMNVQTSAVNSAGFAPTGFETWAEPRSYGVTLTYRY